jgi:hypothetical protein
LPTLYGKGKAAVYFRLGQSAAHNKAFFEFENQDIGLQNAYFWDSKAE